MNRNLYVLEGKEPRRARGVLEWLHWFAQSDRTVALTVIDELEVSTVFIGIDHDYSLHGTRLRSEPMLFETAIFHAGQAASVFRHRSWADAESAHAYVVGCIQDALHKRRIDPNQAIVEAEQRWLQRGVSGHGNAS